MGDISCPICAKEGYRNLIRHITGFHHMSIEEFRSLYPNNQIYDEGCRENFRKGAKNALASMSADTLRDRAIHACETKKSNDPDYYKKWNAKLWNDPDYRKNKIEQVKEQHRNGLTDILFQSTHNTDRSKYRYTSISGNSYSFRSSWELALAQYLDKLGIKFTYESLRIRYFDSESGSVRSYYPDFYLSEFNWIIEVKPKVFTSSQNSLDKKKACIEQGYEFEFFTEENLSELGI